MLELICAGVHATSECWEHDYAAEAVLALPDESITREQREELMTSLSSMMVRKADKTNEDICSLRRILALMVMLMRKPTFYPVSPRGSPILINQSLTCFL